MTSYIIEIIFAICFKINIISLAFILLDWVAQSTIKVNLLLKVLLKLIGNYFCCWIKVNRLL